MKIEELLEQASELEEKIRSGNRRQRVEMEPQFRQVISRLRRSGVEIPAHLRRTLATLTDEIVEDRFDNMPV